MHRVVVGALVQDGHVLLVHRRPDKRANPDVWDVPGGVMEPGETELETLVRELQEEFGVQVDGVAASRLCRVTTGPADEHDDLRWFSLRELPPPPHIVVREAVVAALQCARE